MNFDEGRSGTFTVAGEEFRYTLGVSPELTAHLMEIEASGVTEINPDAPWERTLANAKYVDEEILIFLADDEERKRWKAMRKRKKDVGHGTVGMMQMLEIQRFLWGREAGRPPTPPESSSDSPSTNGTPSTESSSPAPVVASRT